MRFQFFTHFIDTPGAHVGRMPRAPTRPGWTSPDLVDTEHTGEERLFWRECRHSALRLVKAAISLSIATFSGVMLIVPFSGNAQLNDLPLPALTVIGLIGLLCWLERSQNPLLILPKIVKLTNGLILIYLLASLWMHQIDYSTSWGSLLLVYLFSYGQLLIPIGETLVFAACSLLLLPLTGCLLGIPSSELAASTAILTLANLFGYASRRHLEQQTRHLFKARINAEMAAEDKIRLLRQIGHNLRQPLQALGCHASVLETLFADYPDPNLKHFVGRMATTIDEVNNNCNRILDFANLELGRQLPVLGQVDINTVLAGLESQFQVMALRRGVELKVHMRQQPPYRVNSDASILTQILCNLLDNAVKFTPTGWIVVKAVKTSDNYLKVHIVDSGPGIDERQKLQIFRDEVHGHRRGCDGPVKGFGIGLSFVAKAMEQLAGHRLELYSKPGYGSDFKLYLPIAEQGQAFESIPSTTTAQNLGLLVLLVDDERGVVEALGQCLRQYGCRVETASSVGEFRLMLDDCLEQPDLLITDYYLNAGETAEDIIAILEAACGNIPSLILSAMAIPDAVKARLSDRVALLRKPAALPLLLETICKLTQKTRHGV